MHRTFVLAGGVVAAALVLLNERLFGSPALGLALLLGYLLGYGAVISRQLSAAGPRVVGVVAGVLLWTSAVSFLGGVTYRLWNLTLPAILAVTAGAPLLLVAVGRLTGGPSSSPSIPQAAGPAAARRRSTSRSALIGLSAAAAVGALALLAAAATEEPIRSPWLVVPPAFFALIFLVNLGAAGWAATVRSRDGAASDFSLLAVVTGCSLAVGLVVYRIGYGFDPFVHQATEVLIRTNGVVDPKPWYYLGQHALVVILATIGHLDVRLVDTLLLPTLATLALPTILLVADRRPPEDRAAALLTALTLLALPLTWFIDTTPQGLANLVLLAVIFLASLDRAPEQRTALDALTAGLALVATVIHPLAGLPAMMFVSLAAVWRRTLGFPWRRLAALTAAAALVIPAALFVQGRAFNATAPAAAAAASVVNAGAAWPYLEQRYHLVLDAAYHVGFNLPLLLLALAAAGATLAYRTHDLRRHLPALAAAGVLALDGLVVNRFLTFNFLIEYERTAYGDRLLELALFFLLPLAAVALLAFWRRVLRASRLAVLLCLLLLAALRTDGLYLTYPRYDGYAFDRGYSTSRHDLETVRAIDRQAGGPYIVLANQAVSAAALRELGFKRYFRRTDGGAESVFFYPIPTGGTLYQYYLRLVYGSPDRRTVEEAMALVGVREGYFVLNRYWANSEALADEAKRSADEWWTIGDDAVYVFKYQGI